MIVRWLNDPNSSQFLAEVSRLIEDLKELESSVLTTVRLPLLKTARKQAALQGKTLTPTLVEAIRKMEVHKYHASYSSVMGRVTRVVRGLRYQAIIMPASKTRGKRTKPILRLRMVPHLTAERHLTPPDEVLAFLSDPRRIPLYATPAEARAWVVMLITGLPTLDRIRKCRCEKWFFATRIDKQACSEACRKSAYEKTKKRGTERREYMREYMRGYREGKPKKSGRR